MKRLVRFLAASGISWFAVAGLGQAPQAVPGYAQAPAPATTVAPAPAPVSPEKQIATLQARLNDFAQLAHFKTQNAALAPPAAGEQRVVFFGDSITEIWGRRGGTFFPGKPYVNRGISGQATPQMVLRFHQDVVDLHPKVVVILAGTNDVAEKTGPMTPEMTIDDFRAMVEMARANGIKVVICSIPPDDDFYWNKGLLPAPKIRALNKLLEAWCKSEGIIWVDYYTPLADENGAMKPGMSADGTHPTAAGYAIMAPMAEAGIQKALAK